MSSVIEGGPRPSTLDAAASKRLSDELGDSSAVATLRAKAAELAERLPAPDPRRERPWKYADLAQLDLSGLQPGLGATWQGDEAAAREHFGIEGEYAAVIALHNGDPVYSESDGQLTLASFGDEAVRATVEKHLSTAVSPDQSKFSALHYAFLRGGIVVDVPAHAEVGDPVRIVRHYEDDGQLGAPHTLIVTGANSRVTIVEDYRSSDAEIAVLPVVEVLPGPGSRVLYTALHRWGAETRVYTDQRTVTDRDSELTTLSLVTGGRLVKSHLTASLEGRGSSSDVLGLTLGNHNEYVDFYTVQDHIGPDTRSDLLIKSALEGRAQAVYYGLTKVGLGARNADANQENRNLLLSKQAKADSDPVLEILTNDVIRVSHGATAGPVDQEQLFYLQSRGISRDAAEDLLIWGFLGQVLDRVPDEHLRDELVAGLAAKLGRSV